VSRQGWHGKSKVALLRLLNELWANMFTFTLITKITVTADAQMIISCLNTSMHDRCDQWNLKSTPGIAQITANSSECTPRLQPWSVLLGLSKMDFYVSIEYYGI